MRNIILIITLIISISCGTDLGEGKFYNYTIKNESGANLIIKAYSTSFPNDNPVTISLNIGEELTKTYQDNLPPTVYDFGSYFGDIDNRKDSLRIIYNNLKVQVFVGECSENLSNPLNFCEYNDTNVMFIFTAQDYKNAEDCNGNCD